MRDINEPISQNSSSRAKFKQRIAGGTVLLIVLAIFLPFIFKHAHNDTTVNLDTAIPASNASAAETSAPANAPTSTIANSPPAPETSPAPTTQESPASAPVEATQSSALTPAVGNEIALPPPQASAVADNSTATADKPSPAPLAPPVLSNSNPIDKTASVAPVKKITPLVTSRWILQVGSFSNQENAQQLVAQLRARGFHAYAQRGANARIRVYVGPLNGLKQVQKVQEQIQTQFKVSALVREVHN